MTHQPEDTLNLNGIYPVTKQNTTGYHVDVDIDGPKIIMHAALSIISDILTNVAQFAKTRHNGAH